MELFEGVSTLEVLRNELQIFKIKKQFLLQKPKVETQIWSKIQNLLNHMLIVEPEERWDAWTCLCYLNNLQ